MERKYFSPEETAEMLGLTVDSLKRQRVEKVGIPYYKIGRLVRYNIDDIQNYIDANRVETGRRA